MVDRIPDNFLFSAQSLDPSLGKSAKAGDYSAIVFAGFNQGVFYIKADIERRPASQMIHDYVAMVKQMKPRARSIESIAFQDLLLPMYTKECYDQGEAAAAINGVIPWKDPKNQDKVTRIERLEPFLKLGKIKIFNDAGGRLLMQQLKEFKRCDHDDGPDALEMAINLLLKMMEIASSGSADDEELTA